MNEAALIKLVSETLGRQCHCMSVPGQGNGCPQAWHTWRRYIPNGALHGTHATCFVGRNHGPQAGTITVYFADEDDADAAVEGEWEWGTAFRPKAGEPLRVRFKPAAGLDAQARQALQAFIVQGAGPFRP